MLGLLAMAVLFGAEWQLKMSPLSVVNENSLLFASQTVVFFPLRNVRVQGFWATSASWETLIFPHFFSKKKAKELVEMTSRRVQGVFLSLSPPSFCHFFCLAFASLHFCHFFFSLAQRFSPLTLFVSSFFILNKTPA